MKAKKMPPPCDEQGNGGRNTDAGGGGFAFEDSIFFQGCQSPDLLFSPEAQARLALLAARTGLEPAAIVEALIRGADPQLVRTVATLTPRLVGSGWRPRRLLPVQFIVSDAEEAASCQPFPQS